MAKPLYIQEHNSVNLMTAEPSRDNKAYLVDKRLVDFLLKQFTVGTLDDIKNDLIININSASTKQEVFDNVDNYIYLNKVVSLLPKEEKETTQVGKIALPVDEEKQAEKYTNDWNKHNV